MERARQAMVSALAAVLSTAAALCLGFMMLITVADVALRTMEPNWRIFGMLDYVELSLGWMIFLSIAVTTFARAWVAVDLLEQAVPRWLRLFMRAAGLLLLLAALVLTLWQTVQPALDALDWGDRTLDMGWPKFWYWLAIWCGLGAAAVGVVLVAADDLREGARGNTHAIPAHERIGSGME